MGGLLDLTTRWDFWQPAHGVVPTADRDLTRSTPQWAVTFPRDSNLAEGPEKVDKFVKMTQEFMATAPLGARYSGPVNGKNNPQLIASLLDLQSRLSSHTNLPFIASFGTSSSLNKGAVQTLFKTYQEYAAGNKQEQPSLQYIQQRKKAPKEDQVSPSATIKAFQMFLSQTQPLIGKVYQGPTDGQVNNNLISAAKQVESIIASYIDNPEVHGSLWSDNNQTFNTTPGDLKSALQLIVSHQNQNKDANNNHQSRILSFSSLLIK